MTSAFRRCTIGAGVALAAFGAVLVPFLATSTGAADATERPRTAVVFTGAFNRVEHGLYLMLTGQVQRLFISGANAEAGIPPEHFEDQFVVTGDLLAARREGRLVLGTEARSTLENAAETACWLTQEVIEGPVLLITSSSHLPRATAALRAAVPDMDIVGMSVRDRREYEDDWYRFRERAALEATRLLGLLPQRLRVRDGLADCSEVRYR